MNPGQTGRVLRGASAEALRARAAQGASVIKQASLAESLHVAGIYFCEGFSAPQDEATRRLEDRLRWIAENDPRNAEQANFELLRSLRKRKTWEDEIHNLITTVGMNSWLDNFLAGSSYTVTGPYMGLISSTSWSAVNAGDTMSSHSGWKEAGDAQDPTYSGTRKTMAFSSASSGSKALSSSLTFSFTGSGTVKGAFAVLGSGAVNTIDSTAGTLFSAGAFTGGDKTVGNGDSIAASYSANLS